MSTSESWGVNGHTARYTSPVSVVWQCKLVSGWGLRKRRSAPSYGPCGLGRTLLSLLSFAPQKFPINLSFHYLSLGIVGNRLKCCRIVNNHFIADIQLAASRTMLTRRCSYITAKWIFTDALFSKTRKPSWRKGYARQQCVYTAILDFWNSKVAPLVPPFPKTLA